MRWLYADPHQPDEAAYVKDKLAKIDAWWQEFQAQAPEIEKVFKKKSSFNLPRFMEENLQAIHPGLMWEYGSAERREDNRRDAANRLVITPESRRLLRPMVRTLLERAPKMEDWEFYAYRQPESADQAIAAVKGRVGVDITGAVVDVRLAAGRKVDLAFAFPGHRFKDETALQAALAATETVLGEQLLDAWVGDIGVIDGDSDGRRPLPLAQAQATIAALIRGMVDQLPQQRATDISVKDGWATIKLEPPEEADDYPARDDLIVAATHDVMLFEAMHCGQPFVSSCHSSQHETFCYLKLDASDVEDSQRAASRAAIEIALNPRLLAAGVGGCIGGGSGLQYAYVDLALTNIKQAAPILRQTLAEQGAPPRSWLLFHDDDLSAEWIGMFPDTPEPPGLPEE